MTSLVSLSVVSSPGILLFDRLFVSPTERALEKSLGRFARRIVSLRPDRPNNGGPLRVWSVSRRPPALLPGYFQP